MNEKQWCAICGEETDHKSGRCPKLELSTITTEATNMNTYKVFEEKTREGNEIYPADCEIRNAIRGNSKSICANCKHVADACQDVDKRKSTFKGYTEIYSCSGFELMADA